MRHPVCFARIKPFWRLLGVLWLIGGTTAASRAHADEALGETAGECSASDPDALEGERVDWQGACLAGRIEGHGTLTRLVGSQILNVRVGEWHVGVPSGRGVLTRGDGVVIQGTWVDGRIEGDVRILYASGAALFEGTWHAGSAQGLGTYHYPDGSVYSGQWLAGKRSGSGTLMRANGDQFEGDWLEDEGNGEVRERMADGAVYNGGWQHSQRHGHGVLREANGRLYEGEFCFDLLCPAALGPKDKFGIPPPQP
jgi:hypothetical protein